MIRFIIYSIATFCLKIGLLFLPSGFSDMPTIRLVYSTTSTLFIFCRCNQDEKCHNKPFFVRMWTRVLYLALYCKIASVSHNTPVYLCSIVCCCFAELGTSDNCHSSATMFLEQKMCCLLLCPCTRCGNSVWHRDILHQDDLKNRMNS